MLVDCVHVGVLLKSKTGVSRGRSVSDGRSQCYNLETSPAQDTVCKCHALNVIGTDLAR